MEHRKLLLVANTGPEHVGNYLYQAAVSMGIDAAVHHVQLANKGPRWAVAAAWRLDRRPLRLGQYGKSLIERCAQFQPRLVICVGIAPVSRSALLAIRRMGIPVFDYLTDDPWNPRHYARWFLQALRHYDYVFSPRRANLDDLKRHGCPAVSYLPFAYSEDTHLIRDCRTATEDSSGPDIVFVGGADSDRIPFMAGLLQANFSLRLYGGYWERFPATLRNAGGIIPPQEVQRVTASARIALCLVRRANRDGHVMRSLEIPAMGGCMLVESTVEHRGLFGEEGQAVLYFQDIPELIRKARWLLDHPEERQRLRAAVHRRITSGGHTYRDRLCSMLACSALTTDSEAERSHARMGTDR
ncbi:MAG: glycosyltransferase [Acidobacteriia bacterium]|nr:glycosyltransferase [Terriglobia bacterium]MBV9743832.1 glycosyltransferase [Terriglobia bacterium]